MLLSAAFYLLLRNQPELKNRWIAPIALAAAICLKLWGQSALLSFGIGTVLLALAVATIDCAVAAMKSFLQITILRYLGLLSYSLYLWQQPFYKLLRDDVGPVLVLLGGAMLAGTISFYFIEKPARRYINRFWQSLAIRRRMGLQAS
jgi:peptidoglycan/LPS O-acetylase OafA/YrhL